MPPSVWGLLDFCHALLVALPVLKCIILQCLKFGWGHLGLRSEDLLRDLFGSDPPRGANDKVLLATMETPNVPSESLWKHLSYKYEFQTDL